MTLISQLVEENPNCIIVDSGNQTSDPEQIGLIADVLSQLHYDAVGVGTFDANMGEPFFRAMSAKGVTVVCAGPNAPQSAVLHIVKKVDGVRVGVVSFGGTKSDEGGVGYPGRKALYSAFKSARDASDVLVLLDQAGIATPDWIARNKGRLGAADVIIGGVNRMSASQGTTVVVPSIVNVCLPGKSVGVADIEFTPGSAPSLTSRIIQLDKSIAQNETVAARVKEFMEKRNAQLAAAGGPSNVPLRPVQVQFSSETCEACHIGQYKDWASTAHAKAFDRLAASNNAKPECLNCHSERYRRTMDAAAAVAAKSGIECATCHIGSLPHGMDRRNIANKVKVDPRVCVECHNSGKSPNYDEKTYFPRVAHTATETALQSAK